MRISTKLYEGGKNTESWSGFISMADGNWGYVALYFEKDAIGGRLGGFKRISKIDNKIMLEVENGYGPETLTKIEEP